MTAVALAQRALHGAASAHGRPAGCAGTPRESLGALIVLACMVCAMILAWLIIILVLGGAAGLGGRRGWSDAWPRWISPRRAGDRPLLAIVDLDRHAGRGSSPATAGWRQTRLALDPAVRQSASISPSTASACCW